MRREWAAADRGKAVRETAAAWRAAGLFDEPALAAVRALHPETGPRLGWVWRILIFIFVSIASWAFIIGLGIAIHPSNGAAAGVFLLGMGALLVVATELIMARFGFTDTGSEAATSLGSVLCLGIGFNLLLHPLYLGSQGEWRLAAGVFLVILAAAAWRWGYLIYTGGATVALVFLLATFPGGRLLMLATGLLLAAAVEAVGDRPALAPAHRSCMGAVQAVSLLGAYVAVNAWSVDHNLIEELGTHHFLQPTGSPGVPAWTATFLLPLAVIAWGAVSRRRLLLDCGGVLAALSCVTLRFYIHLAPLWVILSGSGAALIVASLAISRWLRTGPGGERSGFTTAPLYDDRRREALLPVVAALAMAPEARLIPERPEPFKGGGGKFGGGGAQTGF